MVTPGQHARKRDCCECVMSAIELERTLWVRQENEEQKGRKVGNPL